MVNKAQTAIRQLRHDIASYNTDLVKKKEESQHVRFLLVVTLTNSSSIWSLIIQGVLEVRAQILTTSYWLHVELGKNI
jgi:hypothetical protein